MKGNRYTTFGDVRGGRHPPSGLTVAPANRPTPAVTLESMIFLGLLLFVAAEIAAFAAVAAQIGFLWALGLLVLVSALGPFVVRRVGVGVMVHTQQRLARGEVPTRELLDGLVVLLAGVMICVPGFIGDALGLLLMISPVRHLLIRAAGHRMARRVQTIRVGGRWVPEARPHAMDVVAPPPSDLPARLGPGDDRPH
jgi:UPF0716 protein FxsA